MTTALRKTALAVMVGAMMIAPAMACSTSDIKIKQADLARTTETFAIIVGEVINGCDDAASVQLHLVIRDSAGLVLGTAEMFAPDFGTIAAHGNYAFTGVVRNETTRPVAKWDVVVTQARTFDARVED